MKINFKKASLAHECHFSQKKKKKKKEKKSQNQNPEKNPTMPMSAKSDT